MDKIEELLGTLLTRMDSMETQLKKIDTMAEQLASLDERVTSVDERVASLEEKIVSVDGELTKVRIGLENVTNKNIQLLIEGQTGMNDKFRRLDELEEKVEDIQGTVSVLKALTVKK